MSHREDACRASLVSMVCSTTNYSRSLVGREVKYHLDDRAFQVVDEEKLLGLELPGGVSRFHR